MPGRHRDAKNIWEALRTKKGPDLVKALSEELDSLHRSFAELEVLVGQIRARQDLSANLFLLDETPDLSAILPKAIDLVASNSFEPQDGFYWLEQTNDEVPFRWTGPQRHFSFSVNIDRANPVMVRLEVISLVHDSQRYLDLHVDGVALPFRLEPAAGGYIGQATLPVSPTRTTTKLTFVLPTTLHPQSAGSDTRELGVAFSKLSLRPVDHWPPPEAKGVAHGDPEASKQASIDAQRTSDPQHDGANVAITSTTLSQVFSFTAGHIRDGHPGFFGLEFEENGSPFRWTGGQSSFSFSIPVDRQSPLELQLKVIAVVDVGRQSTVIIDADGTQHSMKLFEAADEHLEGKVIIPARLGAEPTLITFTVPVLLKPKGKDTRKLGIAFGALHLRPVTIITAEAHELDRSYAESTSVLVEE